MKNKELFDRTVAVLVQAYRNDVLDYTDTCGCAVGNICAAANGYKVIKAESDSLWWQDASGKTTRDRWSDVFCAGMFFRLDKGEGMEQIQKTGYTVAELYDIEQAFGKGICGQFSHDQKQFNGLLSVYDCLCEIHGVDKNEVTAGEAVFTR